MKIHEAAPYDAAIWPTLLTTAQVARILAVSPATVRRLVAGGSIPKVQVGRGVRFVPAEIADLIGGAGARTAPSDGGEAARSVSGGTDLLQGR